MKRRMTRSCCWCKKKKLSANFHAEISRNFSESWRAAEDLARTNDVKTRRGSKSPGSAEVFEGKRCFFALAAAGFGAYFKSRAGAGRLAKGLEEHCFAKAGWKEGKHAGIGLG